MRVAMIGLGDIARKAYLPALAMRSDVELCLVTRDPATLAALAADWRPARFGTDLDGQIRLGLDAAFVHAATVAHEAIATRLLQAGIPTYVDKPLAADYAGAERLVELAERQGVSLMVGFNRRFAPAYAQMRAQPRDLIVMHKHRVNHPDVPRTAIFDDFIHVIDTLRFLLPGTLRDLYITLGQSGGKLHHVTVTLLGEQDGATCTAIGVMNRLAGTSEEILEVSGLDGDGRAIRHRSHQLGETWIAEHGDDRRQLPNDWTPVAMRRGIQQACDHFLCAVRAGQVLDARDSLLTHRICETIVQKATDDA
jgi:virulence factor